MNSWVNRCTPAVDGDVIHGDAALGQQLLDVPVGQAVAQVPADRERDHLPREPEAGEDRGRARCSHQTSLQSSRSTNATVPEQLLSAWMSQNAFVSWLIRERPWELEHDLITTVDLPLNLEGNTAHRFHSELTQVRARCVAQANELPVLPNTGRGGR